MKSRCLLLRGPLYVRFFLEEIMSESLIYEVLKVKADVIINIRPNPPAIIVAASGLVLTTGWTHPNLSPWAYIVPPADGILDLNFVARPPTGLSLQVICPIHVTTVLPVPRWVRGVRVHSSTNEIEALVDGAGKPSEADLAGDGMPLPWPFPWWAPKSRPA
jgi:hypothetical protein